MTTHDERVRGEFTLQAEAIARSGAFGDGEILDRIAALVAAGPDHRVLDVACGAGQVAQRLGRDAGEVIGVDMTEGMLAQARVRCADLPNVRFESGNALALPFGDGEFDRVVTRLSFHHMEDPGAVLAEMRRVSRRGGHVVAIDVATSEVEASARLHNALETLRDPSHVEMLPPSRLERLFTDLGLPVTSRDTWRQPRGFDEWASIASDAGRTAPLRDVMVLLAMAGVDAGIELHVERGEPRFVHHCVALVAAV